MTALASFLILPRSIGWLELSAPGQYSNGRNPTGSLALWFRAS
jgi:hypothetical protein